MRTNSELTSEIKMRLRVLIKTKKTFSYFQPSIDHICLKKKPSGELTQRYTAPCWPSKTIRPLRDEVGEQRNRNKKSTRCISGSWTLFVKENKIILSPRLPNFIAKDHFMVTGLTVDTNSDFVPAHLPADAILLNLWLRQAHILCCFNLGWKGQK